MKSEITYYARKKVKIITEESRVRESNYRWSRIVDGKASFFITDSAVNGYDIQNEPTYYDVVEECLLMGMKKHKLCA